MTATKKSLRFLTVFALIFAMVISMAGIPASAAGTETWYKGYVLEPVMTVHGYNLTPVKTMGESGTLTIDTNFNITDTSSNQYRAICVVEIRSTNGTVLARDSAAAFVSAAEIVLSINVTKGQQIQIYTQIYDVVSNGARYGNVQYSHQVA